jgi:sec-independent protein translocase protein TatA
MGIGGISVWQLLIILAIVMLLFGTKRLKNIGSDLGGAIKGFRKSMSDAEAKQQEDTDDAKKIDEKKDSQVFEGQVNRQENNKK